VTDQWFSPGVPVSSTSKFDHHNITEILLKVALNTMTLTPTKTRFDLHIFVFETDHNFISGKYL
jgi:hypothetical protein